jgi:hypothetical protein
LLDSRFVRNCLLLAAVALMPPILFAGVFISVNIAPPVLPVYAQPVCPGDGYIWTPGYWAYGPDGYYWVRGTWVLAPRPGFLWTPGYWGWRGGLYIWNAGYWGPHVGFYGGVNYGFGYGGVGFAGGRWDGGVFRYNTAITNVNVTTVHNTYLDRTVVRNTTVVNGRASFNGPGGMAARPNAAEMAAGREQHVAPTALQMNHEHNAGTNHANWASVNHGSPGRPAMSRPAGNGAGGGGAHPMAYKPHPAGHVPPPKPAAHHEPPPRHEGEKK